MTDRDIERLENRIEMNERMFGRLFGVLQTKGILTADESKHIIYGDNMLKVMELLDSFANDAVLQKLMSEEAIDGRLNPDN